MATLQGKNKEDTKPVSSPGYGNRNMDSKNPNSGSRESGSHLPNSNAKHSNEGQQRSSSQSNKWMF